LAFIERQLDNARLHGFEAHDALMCFDISGNQQARRRVGPGEENWSTCPRGRRERGYHENCNDSCFHWSWLGLIARPRRTAAPTRAVVINRLRERNGNAGVAAPPSRPRP